MQVGVRKDRKFLRYLWNEDFNKPPKDFEYQRHIWSKRFTRLRNLRFTSSQRQQEFLEIVTTNFYIDDFVKSVGSTEEAPLHQRKRQALENCSFNLIKWCSNSRTFCNELDESLLTNEKDEIFTKKNTDIRY